MIHLKTIFIKDTNMLLKGLNQFAKLVKKYIKWQKFLKKLKQIKLTINLNKQIKID